MTPRNVVRFRQACAVLACAAIATWVVSATLPAPARAQVEEPAGGERPNVLLIVTDDQRNELMGALPKTRQYFAAEGIRYPNAYATTPMCCPSRTSIFTGRYAHNHGVKNNGRLPPDLQLDDMLQAELQAAGYRTALFGKFLNSWPMSKAPPNFDQYALGAGYKGTEWNINGTLQTPPNYNTDLIGDLAVDFIEAERARPEPWLMVLTPKAPHAPFIAEPAYESMDVPPYKPNKAMLETDRRDKPDWVRRHSATFIGHMDAEREGQYRTLQSVDDMVTRVFGALRRTGQQNTIAFFLSDNGYLWGEHGLSRKGAPYTASVRIPLYMRWPGRIAPGTVDRRFAANIDVTPTVLAALGLPPGTRDGRDLRGGETRRRILLEHWCNFGTYQCRYWASTRTNGYQYIEHYNEQGAVKSREYYDLTRDRWQLVNLLKDGNPANNPPLRRLRLQLAADRKCAGETCP